MLVDGTSLNGVQWHFQDSLLKTTCFPEENTKVSFSRIAIEYGGRFRPLVRLEKNPP